jgi:hypothetical protein
MNMRIFLGRGFSHGITSRKIAAALAAEVPILLQPHVAKVLIL